MTDHADSRWASERGAATVGVDPFVRRWLGLVGLLAVAAVFYPVVPLSGYRLTGYYQVVATGSLLIALRGVAHHRPVRRLGWLLVLGGFGCWVLADLVVSIEQQVWHGSVYPAPSDGLYLTGYGVLAAGALVMVRTRRAGHDMTALLDALIIATGAAVVGAVFVIAPLASASDLTIFGKVIGSAYPIGDVLLIAVIVRMWASPGARTGSYRLLVSALGLTLAADIVWNAHLIATGSVVTRWSDVLWLGSYLMVAAAGCLPLMRAVAEPAPERADTGSPRRRLIVLACGMSLPAATLLVTGATGRGVLWPVLGVGALLITVLVLLRMAGILSTVEVQAEALAQRVAEREVLDEKRRQFVSAVSHELRTPLTSIRGSLEVLADGDTGQLPAKAQQLVEVAARGTERLTRLVNDIIDIERLEAGSFDIRPRREDIAPLVVDAADCVRVLADGRHVELEIGAIDGSVLCDADRIVQALINLMGNALKFTQPGGTVRVSAVADDHEVILSVSDEGRGIPADEFDSIFERFHQVHRSDDRWLGGTGLGLPITKAIVERHGGRIWVESELGVGSTFFFTLPLLSETAAPTTDTTHRTEPGMALAASGWARGRYDLAGEQQTRRSATPARLHAAASTAHQQFRALSSA